MAINVRTDEQMETALQALADAHRVSKQAILRAAVMEKYAREGRAELVRAHALDVIARRRELLDRLAES